MVTIGVLALAAAATSAISFVVAAFEDDPSGSGGSPSPPTSSVAPADDIELLDVQGDSDAEFIRTDDGQVFPMPDDGATWLDRWGVPIFTGLIAGLFAVAAALIGRPRPSTGDSDRSQLRALAQAYEQLAQQDGQARSPDPPPTSPTTSPPASSGPIAST
jgi:hypothetical protein